MRLAGFYSDPHFNHAKIVEYEERPFNSVEEMNEALIKNYNQKVGTDDLIMWVGDCYMGGGDFGEILSRMNGHKVLVKGNHDKSVKTMQEAGFLSMAHQMFLHIGDRQCRVCHYPYWAYGNRTSFQDRHGRTLDFTKESKRLAKMKAKYPPRIKGEVLIHGHTHGTLRRHDNMVHVGVDAWDFGPALIEEVEELVREI